MLPTTSQFIKKYDLRAKKSLGQNFILDKNFTDKIAKSAVFAGKNDLSDEIILEIGPGPASLTRSILDLKPKKLIVVEKDQRCIEILREIQEFYGSNRLEIINGDALDVDFRQFLGENEKIKIISNLPYNIGTLLLVRWLKMAQNISLMTLMLQKEVALRIAAKCNDKNYGRLAIFSNYIAETKVLFEVNRNIFTPPPKVTSAIIELKPRQAPPYPGDLEKLEKITQIAFNQRRKMIKSTLKSLGFDEEMLKKAGIDGNLRPENIEIEEFCRLSLISPKKP